MTQNIRTLLATTCGLVLLTAVAGRAGAPPAAASEPARLKRGAYLVQTMGCNDCHTPLTLGPKGPAPDMTRMLSGHPQEVVLPPPPPSSGPWVMHGSATNTAFAGPWGVSFSANLTSDKDTGLGDWTEEMFMATVRTGRHQGKGRPILPPMPIQILQAANDQDLKDIFLYLRSLPAIHNKVPTPIEPAE